MNVLIMTQGSAWMLWWETANECYGYESMHCERVFWNMHYKTAIYGKLAFIFHVHIYIQYVNDNII